MTETAGILPKKFAKRPKPISRTQAIKLIKFAQEHNFVINPAGYAYYAQSFGMFGCCPCDASRKECPCEQAITEVPEKGKCLCHLFWRDYKTYLEESFKEEKK